MSVELATAYVSIVPSARGMGRALEKEMGGAGSAGSKAFGVSFSGGMAKIGKAAGASLGLATVGAAAVGTALFKVGTSFDDAYDKIRTGTGKTGLALAGLEGDFKAVSTTVPASFGDASTAITDLSQRLGLTGVPLQTLAGQMLDLSRITDTDLTTNVDNLTRVFGDWNISTDKMPGALDKVFRASQASGIGIDQLSQSVVQFGAPLRNLGFGFDDSLALIAQFNKTGVNTETVFAGMKAGVGKMAKAGEKVPDTFKRVVDEITKLGPGTESTAKAIELFGQRAGPDLADAITGGKFEIGGLLDTITNGSDTITTAGKDTADWGEKLEILKNKVLIKLEPIASKAFDAVGQAVDKAGPFIDDFGKKFADIMDKLGPKITEVVDVLKGVDWAKIIGGAVAAITPVADAVANLAGAVGEFIVNNWPKVEAALPTIQTFVGLFSQALADSINFVADNLNTLGPILLVVAAGLVAIKAAEGGAAVLNGIKTGETVTHIKQLNSNFDQFLVTVKNGGGAVKRFAVGAKNEIGWFVSDTKTKLKTAGKAVADFGGKLKTSIVDKAKSAGSALKDAGTKALDLGKSMAKSAIEIVKNSAAWVANTAATIASKVATAASTIATTIATAATAAFNFVMALNPVVLVVIAIVALIAILVLAYTKIGWFRDFVDKAFSLIRDVVVTAVGILVDVIKAGFGFVQDNVSTVLGVVKQVVSDVFAGIAWIVGNVIDGIKLVVSAGFAIVHALIIDPITKAKDTASTILDGLTSLFSDLPGKLADGLSSLADKIAAPFKAMGQAIKDAWNSTIGGKGFTIPDIPGLPGAGKRVEIPTLHTGGLVTGRPGDEVLRILEAGEWVLSRAEVASLKSGGREPSLRTPHGGDGPGIGTLQVTTVANANADEVVRAINAKLGWAHTTRRDR
jgi:TP901 family phage tail tape measure protein